MECWDTQTAPSLVHEGQQVKKTQGATPVVMLQLPGQKHRRQAADPPSTPRTPPESRQQFRVPVAQPIITCLLEWAVSLFFMVSNPVSLCRRPIWSATRSFMMEFKASCSSARDENFSSELPEWASALMLLHLFSAGSQKRNPLRDLCKYTDISSSHKSPNST